MMKVFESIFLDDLVSHLNYNKILTERQHGFRKARSTATNMIEFWDEITDLADTSSPVSIIYTDLRKAFDTVPHELLLLKLNHYGIRGNNFNWLKSYLKNRTQLVTIKDQSSEAIHVKSGVPQGGVLSGVLFSIYSPITHRREGYRSKAYKPIKT